MTSAENLLPDDERLRLAECAREPIRHPGAIQPHGALLAVDPSTLEVRLASANCGELLGLPATDLIGRSLDVVSGRVALSRLRAVLASGDDGIANPVAVRIANEPYDAIVHRADGLVVVELEPTGPLGADRLLPSLLAVVHRLSTAPDVDTLRAEAARAVRRLTGFDRVMVYHFHPDGHGEVVAEDASADVDSYLGLHYPASDIPAQARLLYVVQPSRQIVTTEYEPAALVPGDNPLTGAPLDLSLAELRSVSPHHLQFMRNMGVEASLSLSLLQDGELVGMISCTHRQHRHVPYVLRQGLEMVAAQVALRLAAMTETGRLRRRLELSAVRTRLVEQMVGDDQVVEGLLGGDLTVLDLVNADGATLSLDGDLASFGRTPPHAQVETLVDRLREGGQAVPRLVSDALPAERPDLARLVPSVAGVVLVPCGGGSGYLAWWRREVVQTIDWLGDQSPENRVTPLSPRNSFAQWRQTVRGRSLPWEEVDAGQAVELARDVDNVLLRKAQARLAHQGMHDPLTSLPNRRLLMDRLEHALAARGRGSSVALLFIDLDRFKEVNDSFGHDVGDDLLVQVARRIESATRAVDTVARLGGDEFVVLCQDADVRVAGSLAHRVVASLRHPVAAGGQRLNVTASVGFTVAGRHHDAAALLREADRAMYVAKEKGRDQAVPSRFDDGPDNAAAVHEEPP